ncbi:uncharacterized protein LOC142829038 [Pelodiscus sinensis]|uniref:uncharacterized protein LOC142829038 n=1 Tax=Pelodiscus sinensis TaxID=13735 RepID=UPI003F6C2981
MPIKQEQAEAIRSRIASMEKRQRRRKKCRDGKPRADSCDLMDSDKSSDFVARLAHKYMQKCTVESSTESESESNNECLPSRLTEGVLKKANDKLLQFLDPYDGDSEEASTHSDCSLNSLTDMNYSRVTSLHNFPKMVAEGDIYSSENLESPHLSSNWVPPVTEICDVYMQPVNDLRKPMEVITKEKSDVPLRLAGPCELSRTSAALASAIWLTSDSSLLMNVEPSKYEGALASPVTTPLQQPMLAKFDGENMCDQLIVKRKQGLPLVEGISEKLRRKKLRAT